MSPDDTDQLQSDGIYIVLYILYPRKYHWSLFVPTANPGGEIWNAIEKAGGWFLETKRSPDILNSMSIAVALKVGSVPSANLEAFNAILTSVPTGKPSIHTNEKFDSRVWVKDSLEALRHAGFIKLKMDIEDIEDDAVAKADKNQKPAAYGRGRRQIVINSTGY